MEITVNGERRSAADGQTVADLVRELDVPRQGIAVVVGSDVVPGDHHDLTTLREGDVVEIVAMVGGG